MRSSRSTRILNTILLVFVLAWTASALAQTPTPATAAATTASPPTKATTADSHTTAAPVSSLPDESPPPKAATAPPASTPPYLTKTTRLLVLGGAALITFLLYFFASGLHPLQLIVGQDNRYSNSKFQVALWFFVLITTYIAIFALRVKGGVIGQINIPEHLLLLSGMSAFTYAAAKGITTSKVNEAQAQGIVDPKNTAKSPSLLDLTHDDGSVPIAPAGNTIGPFNQMKRPPSLDLGDTQMIIVTLLAVAAYLYTMLHFMGNSTHLYDATVKLPDVDSTILSIFGIGQGAYITKKAVGNVGQS